GGGDGETAETAYIIEDCEDLQVMNQDLSAYYELGGDIDCSITNPENQEPEYDGLWSDGKGFAPVGKRDQFPSEAFTGHLDGQGYIISDLFINRPDEDDAGLFGYIDTDASIQDVGLINANITGNENAGA